MSVIPTQARMACITPIRIFSISPDTENWIMVDSGAAVSVCPISWARSIKAKHLEKVVDLRGASGDPLDVIGYKNGQPLH